MVAQRGELATARAGGYTVESLVDFDGVSYEELDGEAELLPGVHCIPTPGHVDGHQSLVVECDDGSIVLAGQSHDAASRGAPTRLPRGPGTRPRRPAAVVPGVDAAPARLRPARVVFAHDAAVWTPG